MWTQLENVGETWISVAENFRFLKLEIFWKRSEKTLFVTMFCVFWLLFEILFTVRRYDSKLNAYV